MLGKPLYYPFGNIYRNIELNRTGNIHKGILGFDRRFLNLGVLLERELIVG